MFIINKISFACGHFKKKKIRRRSFMFIINKISFACGHFKKKLIRRRRRRKGKGFIMKQSHISFFA
jgi:hypothetical protein